MFGAFLTDLLKAFDYLSHKIIIAKLNVYGFSLSTLKLIHNYLSKRLQRTKINQSYSKWKEIIFGVPQGSILGPTLFNIFMSHLFLVNKDVNFLVIQMIIPFIKQVKLGKRRCYKWFTSLCRKTFQVVFS